MPIYRLLRQSAFDPDDIARMVAVYEDALQSLGLAGRDDSTKEIVAKKIIEIARSGVKDSAELRALALTELGIPPGE